jgi:ATP-binding cassette subfamily F protein 3
MSLISASGLSKLYGTRLCFRDADFALAEGARVGLIGANGTGKTSLFRLLLGDPDHGGTLARRKDLRIATLEQDPHFPPGITVRDALLHADAERAALETEIRDIHERLETGAAERLLSRLSELETLLEQRGGYDVAPRAERILEGVGFPRDRRDAPVDSLSGGERSRVAFARILMVEPDLWLLDEPTNHLDIDGLLFLEEFLARSPASSIVISHDRRFLDRVTTETWEIEGGRFWRYPAPCSRARELRAERLKSAWREYGKQRDTIANEEEFIRRYGAGQRARQAQGRLKRLERLQRLERPQDRARVMGMGLESGTLAARKVLTVRDLSAQAGERTLFEGVSLELARGETLGIAGPNGSGKTTLLGILMGLLAPRSGDARWGERVQPALLSQHEEFPDDSTTPYRFLREAAPRRTEQQLRDLLAAMLFQGDQIDTPVSVLSGGERKRLVLTKLLVAGNNVLLLDEPTNHLDLPSREALELALCAWDGTLILVSHDRHFLDQLADRVLWIEDGAGHVTEGGFAEALDARLARKSAAASAREPARPAARPPAAAPARAGSPLSYLKTEDIEKKIIVLEARRAALEASFADPSVYLDATKSVTVRKEIETTKKSLRGLEEEYARRA